MKNKTNKVKLILISVLIAIVIALISFIIYEVATVNNKYYINEKNLQIPIFVYHDIVDDKSKIEFDYMQTDVDTFEKQITGLMNLGYKPISYEDLVAYYNGEKQISKWSFLITFDDGYTGVYNYAYPIAKKYNIPMTSFAIGDRVGKEECYTWEQAKEMYDSGLIGIYSHGLQHLQYNEYEANKLLEMTNQAYDEIRTNLQDENILKVFTYPYGLYTNEEIALMQQNGYVQNLTDNRVNLSNKLDIYSLHRCYPLNDSVLKILLKIQYRVIRYQ